MTNATQSSIRHVALGDLETELQQTRRVLERVTTERLDWKHHDKSRSFGELAQHLAELPSLALRVVEHDEIDFGTPFPKRPPITTSQELLATFDQNAAKLVTAVNACDDDRLLASFKMRRGDHVFFDASRVAAVRRMGISHMIHHRGQLTVFLRELGIPVPGVYGPSADER
jgi:uncharacterized damage-inducible protein DinB